MGAVAVERRSRARRGTAGAASLAARTTTELRRSLPDALSHGLQREFNFAIKLYLHTFS